MRNDRIFPLPEIIFPGPWDVRHVPRGGHASRAARVFGAPQDDTPFARGIRIHEYAHVRFSPDRPRHKRHGVGLDTLLAVEDARVNECAARSGLADPLLAIDDPAVRPPHPAADLRGATLFLVAAHRTGAQPRALAMLGAAGDAGALACRLAARATEAFTAPGRLPGFRVTVEVARMLDGVLGRSPDEAARLRHGAICGLECVVGGDDGAPREGRAGGKAKAGSVAGLRWGELRRVEEPALSVPCRSPWCTRGSRATDEGTVLRSPHRLLVDGRVFARRRRLPGGTVLIDASGSMQLSPDGLVEIVDAVAGALVACYDGAAEGWGAIRVLARGGRRVANALVGAPTGHGGNVIDGPALRWLARKPAPRVWVSDGRVTGIGDARCDDLAREADDICAAARITHVKNVAGAVRLLRSARGAGGAAAPAGKAA